MTSHMPQEPLPAFSEKKEDHNQMMHYAWKPHQVSRMQGAKVKQCPSHLQS
ncbi:hypothetical protein HanRHA438_Chr09g0394541 [Helianthus annuus]|nr:hypothetical protein HanRHA438_Chr09g0394541 [Helianthus annuus]